MEVLLFKLSEEPFAIPIEYVEAIEHMAPLTYVPKAKRYIDGLVNIRGTIIPVVDMAKFLNLDTNMTKDKLVLIRYKSQPMALVVSDVDDVIDIEAKDVEVIENKHEKFSIINFHNMIVTYLCEEVFNKI